jgi:hypothetical protein
MSALLPDKDRRRLSQMLEMARSYFDAEAASAARMANRLVREHGLAWHEVLTPSEGDAAQFQRGTGETVAELAADTGSLPARALSLRT